ncbi:unnamed protein product [Cunninghamella echinulata]
MNIDLIKKKHWHTLSIEEITTNLQTSSVTGLTAEQVNQRREIFGLNEISSDDGPKWLKIALRQLVDIMNWIFIIFGVACYVLSDYPTGTMLLVIAILNFYLSFSQEYAAEQTLAALRNLSSPMAKVIRDGHPIDIQSNDLVPGDLLMINHGDSVAADLRLTKISNLEVDESLLTGESVPVCKNLAVLENLGKIKFLIILNFFSSFSTFFFYFFSFYIALLFIYYYYYLYSPTSPCCFFHFIIIFLIHIFYNLK